MIVRVEADGLNAVCFCLIAGIEGNLLFCKSSGLGGLLGAAGSNGSSRYDGNSQINLFHNHTA